MICISIGDIAHLDRLDSLAPDLVELRFDLLGREPEWVFERVGSDLPVISTCRPGAMQEKERIALLEKCAELGSRYLDIELDGPGRWVSHFSQLSKQHPFELILSYHDFQGTPSEDSLQSIYGDARSKGAGIVKIATMIERVEDILSLFSLYRETGRKVLLGMGEMGTITRLAALTMGSEFTFASMDAKSNTAPGQLAFEELRKIQQTI